MERVRLEQPWNAWLALWNCSDRGNDNPDRGDPSDPIPAPGRACTTTPTSAPTASRSPIPRRDGSCTRENYASLYGEWETTDEPKTISRTFHESLRFPWPKRPVQVVLKKRGGDNLFREIWSTAADPGSRFINAAAPPSSGRVWTLLESGPATEKVDLLLLGEGYTTAELPKFHADAKRLTDKLFATEPFKSRKSDFNVRAIDLPSAESGVNRPHVGKFRRTPVSAEYNIFDSERYLLAVAPLIVGLMRVTCRLFRRYSQRIQSSMGDVTRVAKEALEGHRMIKVFNAQPQEIITNDNLNARVDAQVYFKVKADEESVKYSQYNVYDYRWQIVLRGPDPAELLRSRPLPDWRIEVNPPSLL